MFLIKRTNFYIIGLIRFVGEKKPLTPDVLTMCFCVVGGLKCYACYDDRSPCNKTEKCPQGLDRCFSVDLNGEGNFSFSVSETSL